MIPRDPGLDFTLAIARDGYEAIWNRCRHFQRDLFATRLMGKPAICIHGRAAAELFYDEHKLQRGGAIPKRITTSLFGKNAVHTLDDAAHRHRKAAFMAMVTDASVARLAEHMTLAWRAAARRWPDQREVVLFDEAKRVLAGSVCAWAGIPVSSRELPELAEDLSAMVDGLGGIGPRMWRGKRARARRERWLTRVISRARDTSQPRARPRDPTCALAVVSTYREPDGSLLPVKTAATELLNVIRPTVAIAWYVAFAALAIHDHPGTRERLQDDDDGSYSEAMMQEIRRFYPSTPFMIARVRDRFTWQEETFEPGTRVLLDVYGTLHDPRIWEAGDGFWPDRFASGQPAPFTMIPQGGGNRATGHRCPGEAIAMSAITVALNVLARGVTYKLPPQDLTYDLTRIPTAPHSGIVMRDVRITPALLTDRTLATWAAAASAPRVTPIDRIAMQEALFP